MDTTSFYIVVSFLWYAILYTCKQLVIFECAFMCTCIQWCKQVVMSMCVRKCIHVYK